MGARVPWSSLCCLYFCLSRYPSDPYQFQLWQGLGFLNEWHPRMVPLYSSLFNSSLLPLPTHLLHVFSLSQGAFTLFGQTWAGCYAYAFSRISGWMILEPWGNCPWRLNTCLKQQYFWNSAFLSCEHLPTFAHDNLGTLFYSFFEGSSHFQQAIVSSIILLHCIIVSYF